MLRKIYKVQSFVFIAIFFMVVLLAKNNAYAVDCGSASVQMVGPTLSTTDADKVVVRLRNKTAAAVGTWAPNTDRTFYLHQSVANKGLATLLTAFMMEKTVWVRIASTDAAVNSLVTIVYVK